MKRATVSAGIEVVSSLRRLCRPRLVGRTKQRRHRGVAAGPPRVDR